MTGGRRLGQRRLAAILFADVVGYSRMVAEDESLALARVGALRRRVLEPRIAARGGRPFAALGDGFVAEFPSAVEAVTCAVEVQRALLVAAEGAAADTAAARQWRGLALRIGITLGDVVVEPDGAIYGDGVNVAARLQALAEPGGILASGEVHGQLAGRLALPFEDGGERDLKNIPHAVRLFALPAAAIAGLPAPGAEPDGEPARWRWRRHAALLAAGAVLAATVAAGAGWWASAPRAPPAVSSGAPRPVVQAVATTPAARLSMVVLPFTNLGGDPGQDHIADGVTDDLTAALARIPGSFVIGRGTAFTYRGLAVDVRQIGRDLGVRYVVQGSARRVGPQLRVNAQVLDAATGAHLWAESFEEPLAGIADLTRAVASRIAAALNHTLVWLEGDRARADSAQDPTAVDLLLRGRALLNSARTVEDFLEARRLLERSLALDEGSADAHAFLAMSLVNLWTQGWEEDREGLLQQAEEHAVHALGINPRHAQGHYVRGIVHQSRRRFDQALAAFEITLGLMPNLPFIHARRGWVMNLTGRPADALAEFTQAVRINPREYYIGTTHWGMAFAHLMLGRDEEAAALAVRAAAGNPDLPYVRLQLASTLALVGRTEEARIALAEYRSIRPGMTVERFRRQSREFSGHPLWLATRDREAEALRAIGLPEE